MLYLTIRFVFGIETLIVSAFLGIYGKRILFLLRHSNSKSLEERAKHVSRVVAIMGICAFFTILLLCTAELADFDERKCFKLKISYCRSGYLVHC
jgi:hypothetical protein